MSVRDDVRTGVRVVLGRHERVQVLEERPSATGERAAQAVERGGAVGLSSLDAVSLAMAMGGGVYTPPPPPPVSPPGITDNSAVRAAVKLKDGDVGGAVGEAAAGVAAEVWTGFLNIFDGPRLLYYWATGQPEKALELKRKAWDRAAQKMGSARAAGLLGPRP